MDLLENGSDDVRELCLIAINKYTGAMVGKNYNCRGINILTNCVHSFTILLEIRTYFNSLDSCFSASLLSELFALKDSDPETFKRWLSVENVEIFA